MVTVMVEVYTLGHYVEGHSREGELRGPRHVKCHLHSVDAIISREEGVFLLLTGSSSAHHFLFVFRQERILETYESVPG